MKKEPKPITMDEIMTELDKFRASGRGAKRFTPEMDKVILSARSGERVVPFSALARLWERFGFGHVSHSTLCDRYKRLTKK